MTSQFTQTFSGSYISAGTPFNLVLPGGVDWYEQVNITQFGASANPGVVVEAKWHQAMTPGYAIGYLNTNSTNALNADLITANGFTPFVQSGEVLGAIGTGTTITNANPAHASQATHGYSNGDVVRITQSTGMFQIAGWDFQIANVSTNAYDLTYLDASGFGAGATAFKAQKINPQVAWYPRWRFITKITQATSAVVTTSVDHGYQVGADIRFSVSSSFGMTQINGLVGTITAVPSTSTFTVNINSTAFTAFAFPTSAVAAAGVQFPQAIPLGIDPPTGDNSTEFAFDNQSTQGLYIGSSVCGAEDDVIVWTAFKGLQIPGDQPQNVDVV
jgi:hypothetical protein